MTQSHSITVTDALFIGYVKLIRPRPDGLMWLRSGMVGTC
jgi:hypothetical protein